MKDRKHLENLITLIFKKNNLNKKLLDNMTDELSNKFPIGVFSDVFRLQKSATELDEEQLYLIMKSLYENYDIFKDSVTNLKRIKSKDEFTTNEGLNPDKYFTENEKLKANEINFISTQNEEVWFELDNIDELYDDEMDMTYWASTFVPYRELVDNYNKGAILYNYETQRDGEIRTVYGGTIKVPKLYSKNVNEMAEKMTKKKFYPNQITLNIQDFEGFEKQFIEYYPEEKKLRVKKTPQSVVYIIDGFHRLTSAKKALLEKPELKKGLMVRIFNLDAESAQNVIIQESLGNPLNKETVSRLDNANKYLEIIKRIEKKDSEVTNSLYGRFTSNIDELKYNEKYCLYSTISNALEDNFKEIIEEINNTKNVYESGKLTQYLIDFFNIFIGVNHNKFMILEKTKEKEVMADPNIFAGLLLIAKKLYKTDNWEEKLEHILNNINWNRNDWKDIPTNTTWSKRTSDKIYSKFQSFIGGEE